MATYLTPGVYVEQVPSAIQPIAGVGTSTAAFIGIFPTPIKGEIVGTGDGQTTIFPLARYPVQTTNYEVDVKPDDGSEAKSDATIDNAPLLQRAIVTFKQAPQKDAQITANYTPFAQLTPVTGERIQVSGDPTQPIKLANYPAETGAGTYVVRVNGIRDGQAIIANDDAAAAATVTLSQPPKSSPVVVTVDYITSGWTPAASEAVVLCTSFGDFTRAFGNFSEDDGQRALAHGVYGFFNNGGTRCYVVRVESDGAVAAVQQTLINLTAFDDIAIVAAPGVVDVGIQEAILDHCENLGNRFAILDGLAAGGNQPGQITTLRNSSFAALYTPWITVYDPASDSNMNVAPSGHIARIYARVDAQRGVHNAPANEVIRGALDVQTRLSDADQAGLNPDGINAIRLFSGGVTVWGARTLGGDANEEWKYLSVRRLMIFLAQSIKQGTQWVVFEPNDAALWAKITRNVTAFLTLAWRSGALFGATPQQAFFVKCDAETNPEEVRDAGQVVTQIGVAVTKPAEFVIFQISQWAGPSQ